MAGLGARIGWARWPRPLRWLAVAGGVLAGLVVLLALALAVASDRFLRPILEEQASVTIPGDVTAGSLDVGIFGGNVTVTDLAIRAPEPGAQPAVEIGRLHLALRRLPLLAGRIVVRKVEIEDPRVRLVRHADGELDLLRIVVPESPPVEEPPAPESDPIPIRVDAVELGAGRIEFVDEMTPGAEPILVTLPAVRIDNLVVSGDPGEDPADVHLEVSAEGASIEVEGRVVRRGDALDVDATVEASKLPLGRARVYLPDLGWNQLGGELDARLHYVHQTDTKQTLDGEVAMRDLRVVVPALADPAFGMKELEVEIEELDLLARRLALGDVSVAGLRLYFDPKDPAKLPLLPKGLPGAAEPAATPAPEAEAPPFAWRLGKLIVDDAQLIPVGAGLPPITVEADVAGLDGASSEPAEIAVEISQGDGSAAVEGRALLAPVGFRGKLSLDELALAPLLRTVAGDVGDLVAAGTADGSLELRIGALAAGDAPAPGGDVAASGTVTLAGLDAKSDAAGSLLAKLGSLEIALEKLEIPGLLSPPPSEWASPPDAGTFRVAGRITLADLRAKSGKGEPLAVDLRKLELGVKQLELAKLLAPQASDAKPATDAGSLRFAGALSLAGVAVKSGKEGEFALDLEQLELGLKEVVAPGLLAPEGAPKPDPLRVALERLRIAAPKLRVMRTEAGIVLPAAPGGSAAAPAPAQVAAEKPAPTTASPAADPALHLELASFVLERGSVRVVDRTVKPFYQGDLTGISITARDILLPGPRVRDFAIKVDAPGPAPLWAIGSVVPRESWFELHLEKLPLAPLNPYVQSTAGYVVNRGELSFYSKGSMVNGQLSAANWIELYDPSLSGGTKDSPLESAVGVPIGLALSLLKDPSGNIGLSVPVDWDGQSASLRLGSVIASAMKQVLVGALTSPLKLIGSVVDAGGRVQDVTPQPIVFLAGRSELGEGAEARIDALAKLLATRPKLELALQGNTSATDGRFVREAALAAAIESGEGLPDAAQGLGQALVRRRLAGALEERLAGRPDELDPEDRATLDAWLEALVLPPDALQQLARERATKVRGLLESQFGLDVARVALAEPGTAGAAPDPAVDVQLEP